jgi:hypothetical protein
VNHLKLDANFRGFFHFTENNNTRHGTCFSDCVGAADLLGVFGFTHYTLLALWEPQVLENHRCPYSPLILYPRSNPSKLIKAITSIQTDVANGSESGTSEVKEYFFHSSNGQPFILLDTPGFDDSTGDPTKNDHGIVRMLKSFVKKTFVYTTFPL